MKLIIFSILGLSSIFVLCIIGSALNLFTIPWLRFDSQVQMNRDIVTKTYNADNALYNYHWFQEQAGTIKANDEKVVEAQMQLESFEKSAGSRTTWTFEDKTEDSRLRSVVLGLTNESHDLKADYNAKAGEADRSIFQNNLPLFFSIK